MLLFPGDEALARKTPSVAVDEHGTVGTKPDAVLNRTPLSGGLLGIVAWTPLTGGADVRCDTYAGYVFRTIARQPTKLVAAGAATSSTCSLRESAFRRCGEVVASHAFAPKSRVPRRRIQEKCESRECCASEVVEDGSKIRWKLDSSRENDVESELGGGEGGPGRVRESWTHMIYS